MSLQLAFGSFGDFSTLIRVIRELAILIRDAATMRRDIRRFTTFLDEYSATMSCIEDILKSGPVHMLPHTVLQCIRNAVREASMHQDSYATSSLICTSFDQSPGGEK